MRQIMLQVITSQHVNCLFPHSSIMDRKLEAETTAFGAHTETIQPHLTVVSFSVGVSSYLILSFLQFPSWKMTCINSLKCWFPLFFLRTTINIHCSLPSPFSVPLYSFYWILRFSDFCFIPDPVSFSRFLQLILPVEPTHYPHFSVHLFFVKITEVYQYRSVWFRVWVVFILFHIQAMSYVPTWEPALFEWKGDSGVFTAYWACLTSL